MLIQYQYIAKKLKNPPDWGIFKAKELEEQRGSLERVDCLE